MKALTVLVVAGSKAERADLVAALTELPGVVVIGAVGRLHTALYAIGESRPDAVVTDALLDDVTGADLIVAARRCARPPAMIVFGPDDAELGGRCLAAGADTYIRRDAGVEVVAHAVAELAAGTHPRTRDRFALIGRLVAGAAHDLNNYLAVIGVALARLDRHTDAATRAELATPRRALDQAERVTRAMLAYASEPIAELAPVDLAECVRRALDVFRRALPMDILVVADIAAVPQRVRGVAVELEQLSLHLVLDAAETMTAGGTLRIGVHTRGDHVVLEVGAPGELCGDGRFAQAHRIVARHAGTLEVHRGHGGSRVVAELRAVA